MVVAYPLRITLSDRECSSMAAQVCAETVPACRFLSTIPIKSAGYGDTPVQRSAINCVHDQRQTTALVDGSTRCLEV